MKNIIIFLVCSINGFVTMESKNFQISEGTQTRGAQIQNQISVATQTEEIQEAAIQRQIKLNKKKRNKSYTHFTQRHLNLIHEFDKYTVFNDFHKKISKIPFLNNVEQFHPFIRGRGNHYIKEKIQNIPLLYAVVIDIFNDSMAPIDKQNFIKIIKHLHRINFDQLEKIKHLKKKFFFKTLSIHGRNLRLLTEAKTYVIKYNIKDEINAIKLDQFLKNKLSQRQLPNTIKNIIEKIKNI
jgi:hypothetical protein